MIKKVLLSIFCLPLFVMGQETKGIKFNQDLTWDQVKKKAREENLFIFLDCYATWCGPCHFMADSVFTRKKVGDFINPNFLAIKVQMDSTQNDNNEIKLWYKDANYIKQEYNINAFPEFLFFSPAGEIVHKGLGSKGIEEFIALAKDALNIDKQYYTLLKSYKKGQLDMKALPNLANTCFEYSDYNEAYQIAKDYIHKYLDTLAPAAFLTKTNLDFIKIFRNVISSKERIFKMCYFNPEKIDSVISGYSKSMIKYVITSEEVTPSINLSKLDGSEPDWEKLDEEIKHKYTKSIASACLIPAKVKWYLDAKNWTMYNKYLIEQVDLFLQNGPPKGILALAYLNNSAWSIFEHSDRKTELKKALEWANIAMPLDPNPSVAVMDTKANILYKLGLKKEAASLRLQILKIEKLNKKVNENTEEGKKM